MDSLGAGYLISAPALLALGFGGLDVRLGVHRVLGLGFIESRVKGSGLRVLGSRVGRGSRVGSLGLRIEVSEFRV